MTTDRHDLAALGGNLDPTGPPAVVDKLEATMNRGHADWLEMHAATGCDGTIADNTAGDRRTISCRGCGHVVTFTPNGHGGVDAQMYRTHAG